jgi:hypothetical protein
VSKQTPLHSVRPGAHLHLPPTQEVPPWQTLPHRPQSVLLFFVSVQTPRHGSSPRGAHAGPSGAQGAARAHDTASPAVEVVGGLADAAAAALGSTRRTGGHAGGLRAQLAGGALVVAGPAVEAVRLQVHADAVADLAALGADTRAARAIRAPGALVLAGPAVVGVREEVRAPLAAARLARSALELGGLAAGRRGARVGRRDHALQVRGLAAGRRGEEMECGQCAKGEARGGTGARHAGAIAGRHGWTSSESDTVIAGSPNDATSLPAITSTASGSTNDASASARSASTEVNRYAAPAPR